MKCVHVKFLQADNNFFLYIKLMLILKNTFICFKRLNASNEWTLELSNNRLFKTTKKTK